MLFSNIWFKLRIDSIRTIFFNSNDLYWDEIIKNPQIGSLGDMLMLKATCFSVREFGKFAFEGAHILADLAFNNFSINLCGFDTWMAKELWNGLYGNSIGKGYGSCKCMPGQMKREVLFNTAGISNLF